MSTVYNVYSCLNGPCFGVFDEVLVYVKLRRLARILKFYMKQAYPEGKTKAQTDLYICCCTVQNHYFLQQDLSIAISLSCARNCVLWILNETYSSNL